VSRRTALTALLVIALSGAAGAQSRASRSTDELPRPTIGLPLPPIGLPLPQIGLALSPTGLKPVERERFERSERPERFERSRSNRSGGAAILFVPAFAWPYLPGTALPGPPATPPPPPKKATGRLHLDLRSGVDPQIYVDGYYVGTLGDVGGEVTLDAGAHSLELRADGYESLRVDVQIAEDGLITYRGELKPLDAAPAAAARIPASPDVPPPAPTTIYMIPGCYVGNVPPKDAGLPAGCDERRTVAFPSRP
jgi:hypothetical protein